ncbi:MAG: hypothetical protein Q8K50_04685 [Hydrogenophaga sp.]|nr:hypothetical protein [Hydrogenophaga sp.]
MIAIVTIGIDYAKNFFAVHGLDDTGKVTIQLPVAEAIPPGLQLHFLP